MSAILLQTTEGDKIGFLLFAGKETINNGDNPRDCVFLSAPSKGELIEHELNQFLSEVRATEFRCTFSQNGDEWEATVLIDAMSWVQLRVPCEGIGSWRVQHEERNVLKGCCELLPRR